jgi:exopolyphosphatase/guanosine-5'-triphosphate,3'-diphosphate pyrophosphatase
MLVVANIARYHRKNIPRKHHADFVRLSEEDQARTTTLSGILRVADALDRSHLQNVKNIEVTWGKHEMELRLEGEGDLLLERWAVSRKTTLFGKVFERDISITT